MPADMAIRSRLNSDSSMPGRPWVTPSHMAGVPPATWAVAPTSRTASTITIVTGSVYQDTTLHLDRPHSLALRLNNDSTKSWLFQDLEDRRRAALTGDAQEAGR